MGRTQVMIEIPGNEKNPMILRLLEVIEQQMIIIQQQAENIQNLRSEIILLKNQKPNIYTG